MRAFRIAYDGTPFRGFQRQPDVETVEGAVFDALARLEVLDADDDKPDGYAAAGRTDAGVSAIRQTIALEAPAWLTPRALNAELPASIRAWASAEAPDDFHARHHAVRREYAYHLHAPGDSIDDGRLETALAALSGAHDFHNLTADDDGTERSLSLEASRDGAYVVLTASAGGFCRGLVRRVVSLARDVAAGREPLSKVDRTLSPEPLPGHEGVPPAPPEPLVLTDVSYPNLTFAVDERAAGSAREVFEDRRVERTTGARVSAQLRDGVR